ncbi:MAG: response regulator transcription factor [Bacteroidales bacterium]|jgi:DNA-binding response OmpR family regulator|nr:response regulator transcription factor [Bacteroidales bacterium]
MSIKNLRVLLAEDDESLGMLLFEYLKAKGLDVEHVKDGVAAYNAFKKSTFDICIFDVMMPKEDGFTLAKRIRATDKSTPIIFLTAKSLKEDIIEGFLIGADDYMTKPFSMEELLLRVDAIMRRVKTGNNNEDVEFFEIGRYNFDVKKQVITIDEKTQKLTTKESELLRLLCINMNGLLERNYALENIWQEDSYFNARSMDVYITKLRKYLKEDPQIEIINIHGKGFKLVVP